jgi:OFA family oxalate/formate antiporter-like MFS transporter
MSLLKSRWVQLIIGIICMVMIANLQYGWTLFVLPIGHATGWSRPAIQVAFTVFVLCETWLLPIEGYVIDRIGPKLTVCAGGVLIGASWVLDSVAASALCRRRDRRHRLRLHLRRHRRQRAQMVP